MKYTLGAAVFVCSLFLQAAASPSWLDQVSPILTSAERKAYLALPAAERATFEQDFWSTRAIAKEEYYRRLQHADGMWGSDKAGSGANTDPGRVYLAIGAPTKVTRLPSSRTFVPLEIWYYDSVPGMLNTELRLIFYRPGSLGLSKLYSPTTDTIRALLVPQASNVHMFGPNDSLTESDIRRTLKAGPAEDEVITAATGIASGIKYSGNDTILGQISSPEFMLSKPPQTQVASRLITSHPQLETLVTASQFGGSQVDLQLRAVAQRTIDLEVLAGTTPLAHTHVNLQLAASKPMEYLHRLDLLPGSYRLVFTVDDVPFAYPLEIPGKPGLGTMARADIENDPSRSRSPFVLEGKRVNLTPYGRFAVLPVGESGRITWIIRKGAQAVWRSTAEVSGLAMVELPTNLPSGNYRLEAVTASDSRSADLVLPGVSESVNNRTQIAYNVNLATAQRLSFVGHQQLLRGQTDAARHTLEAALKEGPTSELQIELARADILGGDLDSARERVRRVLKAQPNNFEALSVYAHVEARLQDYSVAAELYRRALAVQDSPELRAALAQLPAR